MIAIPTYNFHDIGRQEKLVDLFLWTEPEPYKFDTPHCHDYHEMLIFFKGGGSHEIDFKTFEATDHSFHIVPRNFIHQLRRSISSSGFTIAISAVFVEQLCKFDPGTDYRALFNNENVIRLSKSDFSGFEYYLDEIRKPGISAAFMQNTCAAILLRLFPFFSNNATPSSGFAMEVRKAVEENFMKRLSTEQYAELFHMSPVHLNVKLKKAMGKTIMQLQDDTLISKIKQQLYATDNDLKEIAYQSGYRDYSHFSKFFKLHTGYAPSQYRSLLKNIQGSDKN